MSSLSKETAIIISSPPSSSPSSSPSSGINLIIGLPEHIAYHILTYITTPYDVASTLCHQIVPLCKATYLYVNGNTTTNTDNDTNDGTCEYTGNDDIWETVLGGYYLTNTSTNTNTNTTNTSTTNTNNTNHTNNNTNNTTNTNHTNNYRARTQRRSSKRLRRTTAKQDVIHAHFVLRDRTEMALQELADITTSKRPSPLKLSILRRIFKTYGPNLRIDQRSSIGSTFLMDVLRARYAKESVILSCVKELVEVHGASLVVPGIERGCSRNRGGNGGNGNILPPMVVAAARGMSTVVKYILSRTTTTTTDDDDRGRPQLKRVLLETAGTTRFRLYSNPKKSIFGTYTPLEFAQRMLEAELLHGAVESDVKSLNECIRLLSR